MVLEQVRQSDHAITHGDSLEQSDLHLTNMITVFGSIHIG
jgi:hypothetical protein